jgi:hypothetical protein
MTDNLFWINYKNKGNYFTLFSFDGHEVRETNRILMCQGSLNVLLYSCIDSVQN